MSRMLVAGLAAFSASCGPYAEDCKELWDVSHAEHQPVSFEFAERCCETARHVNDCLADVWRGNHRKDESDE